MSPTGSPSPLHIASRVAAGLLGGYGFVWGFVTLGIAVLMAGGMPYDDARTTLYLLAFLLFLSLFCWAFAAASLWRVWAVLFGGGAVMTGAAWLLIPSLI
jgi:hypothetical protein